MKFLEKIWTWPEAETKIREWKSHHKKVVFTNGCFDILHQGHVRYLEEARSMGDYLILGLNSDASVRNIKGQGRPINDQVSRAVVLAGLQSVDGVIFFDQDTPLELITKLLPNVLAKGGDWAPNQIIGSEIVIEKGGVVISLPHYEGYSTTIIEQKIKNEKE
ncbi:MAG: D-glycero-beta-D-manno-heptose 1-phosphate adenylyltransferase [Bacteroidota bacterium]|nr:D-glycero-beta-D-manno-heptose 1-phosphate adenylyltransferase [Bacteroidota bacterium]